MTNTLKINRFPVNAPQRAMRKIARQYANAIVRRGREATNHTFLADVWTSNCAHFIRDGHNYLIVHPLGKSKVYVASHFAPKTLRGGHRLLQKIKEAKLPIIFTVPEDLAANLEKLGWKRLPNWARKMADKHGLPADKEILVPSGLVKIAWEIARKFNWAKLCEKDYFAPPARVEKNNPRCRRQPRGAKYTPPIWRGKVEDLCPQLKTLLV